MKIILSTERLASCLADVSKVAIRGKKGSNPAYQNLQLCIKKNNLYLITFDGNYGMRVKYGGVSGDDYSCAVEYDAFNHLVSNSSVPEIEINFIDEEKKAKIKIGKSKYSLQFSLDIDFEYQYESINFSGEEVFSITPERMSEIAASLIPCIPSEDRLTSLKGIYYDGNFLATDTNVFGFYHMNMETAVSRGVFLPKDSVTLFSSFASKDIVFKFIIDSSRLVAISDSIIFISPELVSKFPAYKEIVDRVNSCEYSIELDTKSTLAACNRLIPFSDMYQKQFTDVGITVSEVVLNAKSENREGKEFLIPISATINEEIKFSVNIKKFLELAKNIDGEKFKLVFSKNVGPQNPIGIMDASGLKYMMSVLIKKGE